MIETFHNFESLLESYKENSRLIGLLNPGVYSGFSEATFTGNMMTVSHNRTGIKKTQEDGLTQSDNLGIFLSVQGEVVNIDEPIIQQVDYNPSNNNYRIDYLIVEKQYVRSREGSQPVFSIIKGPNNGTEPSLTNPKLQILIGKVFIPPNSLSHTQTQYVVEEPKLPGSLSNKILMEKPITNIFSLDQLTQTGIYRVYRTQPPVSGSPGPSLLGAQIIVTATLDTIKQTIIYSTGEEYYRYIYIVNSEPQFRPWQKQLTLTEIQDSIQPPAWEKLTLTTGNTGNIYYRRYQNRVWLAGTLSGPSNPHIGTLPVNHRPWNAQLIPVYCSSTLSLVGNTSADIAPLFLYIMPAIGLMYLHSINGPITLSSHYKIPLDHISISLTNPL